MRCKAFAAIALAAVFSGTAAAAELRVQVMGAENNDGQIIARLFTDSERFFVAPEKALKVERSALSAGRATLVFRDLPQGSYAVAVEHDANANGELDMNFLGIIPVEGWGASRDARGRMGPPKFDDAKVDVGPAGLTIQVQLKY